MSWMLERDDADYAAAGAAAITGFAHVLEAGALCVSDAAGRLLMIDMETRAIEEVRLGLNRLHVCTTQHAHKQQQPHFGAEWPGKCWRVLRGSEPPGI